MKVATLSTHRSSLASRRVRGATVQGSLLPGSAVLQLVDAGRESHIISAFSFELDHCDDPVVYQRLTRRLGDIDVELAKVVAENVGSKEPNRAGGQNKGQRASNLSQFDFPPAKPTIASRRVAILIADGFDP